MNERPVLVRITTVPNSLERLLGGQLSYMNGRYRVIAVSSGRPWLQKIATGEQVEMFCVNMTRQITPLKDLHACWRLYRFFRREKPLIIHSHTPKAGTVGMIAARLAGVPIRMHTVAGLPLLRAKGLKRRLLDFVEKITYACATHVYPNSEGMKTIILKEKLCRRPEKLKVIANGSSNGIDTTRFAPTIYTEEEKQLLRCEFQLPADAFVFVFIGRLVTDKGINELIEAFNRISRQYNQARLMLVGRLEPELDPLKKETLASIHTHPHIHYVEWQIDVRPYLAASDALVFPSYREGFPNVVMQAGAMGLPAIVTDINGCNEIVRDEENGLIVPPENVEALCQKMERLLTDPGCMSRLQSNARVFITTRYQQETVWKALLAEYEQLEAEYRATSLMNTRR